MTPYPSIFSQQATCDLQPEGDHHGIAISSPKAASIASIAARELI